MKIILASNSPRRKELLSQAEIEFEVIVSNIEEVYPNELPKKLIPEYLAQQKAEAVFELLINDKSPLENVAIIAADTIVLLKDEVLGKPKDEKEAFEMLKKLSGTAHKVITGFCVKTVNHVFSASDVTKVFFHPLKDENIIHYIKKYKPFDKAGAYGIQEWIGLIGIEKIEGSYYNVMGLPVDKILPILNM